MDDSISIPIQDSITLISCNSIVDEALHNSDSLLYAFILSVGLLILISLLKYFVSKNSERSDWGNFILEFPIDTCMVIITIIITGFMRKDQTLGVLLMVFSLIVSIFCCIFRRLAIKHSYDEKLNWQIWVYGLADLFLAGLWVGFVLYKIIK